MNLIHEFALEPAAVGTWSNFRYIIDQFGFEHGRLISRFPGKWKRLVYEAAKNCTEIDKKRIEERLTVIDDKMIRAGREYSPEKDWLTNAEMQHSLNPFRAIIASDNPRSHEGVLIADELDGSSPLWKVERELPVPRRAAFLGECASTLLMLASEVLLIDPYFTPGKAKFMNVIKCFLQFSVQEVPLTRIEIHSEYDFEKDPELSEWQELCRTALAPLIPKELKIKVIRWTEKFGGEKIHARYVLTNLGGLRYETGLDEGNTGETTDVSILDGTLFRKRWSNYQRETAAFDLADEVEISGELGEP